MHNLLGWILGIIVLLVLVLGVVNLSIWRQRDTQQKRSSAQAYPLEHSINNGNVWQEKYSVHLNKEKTKEEQGIHAVLQAEKLSPATVIEESGDLDESALVCKKLARIPGVLGWVMVRNQRVVASDRPYDDALMTTLRQYWMAARQLRRELGVSMSMEASLFGAEGGVRIFSKDNQWIAVIVEPEVALDDWLFKDWNRLS
ncbi:hypothetical protein [Alicyclobacillus tolerans]|uniref:Uncharacterized protein n=1 Tax=Alicyclobacillus tolerans TaxID=90970 RepID=A0ABT9LST6_9BACL|nr:hypothetical protein [Alicyclobacillus tengchongensis]MDP9727327.1 hypothetical protein [Alicyclobacillus tengchongensis]